MTFSFTIRIAAGIAALILLIQPLAARQVGSASKPTSSTKSSSVSVSHNSRDDIQRWRTSNGFDNFNVEFRGKIEITDDDKDIKSMSDDGFLEIRKRCLEASAPLCSRLKITLTQEFDKEIVVSREKVAPFKEWFDGSH